MLINTAPSLPEVSLVASVGQSCDLGALPMLKRYIGYEGLVGTLGSEVNEAAPGQVQYRAASHLSWGHAFLKLTS